MMDFSLGQYLVFAGVAVMTVGLVVYIKDTLQGKTKPNKVTWLIWGIAPLIGAVAAYSDGVRLAALPVLATGLGPLAVFAASFINKNAYWKLEKLDYICGAIAILALVLWQITDEPIVAIIFALLGDTLATLPTVMKSWRFPETESGAAYITAVFGVGTSFLVLQSWNFSEWAFPAYLVFVNGLIAIGIYRKNLMSFIGFITQKG